MKTKKTWLIMLVIFSTFMSYFSMTTSMVAFANSFSPDYSINGGEVAYHFEKGNITPSFEIESLAKEKKSLTLYAVLVSADNKIKSVAVDQKEINPNAVITLECVLTIPTACEGDNTKVMIWETDTQFPIIQPIERVVPKTINTFPTPSPLPEVTPTPTPLLDPCPVGVILTADQYIIADDGIDKAVFIPKVYNKYNQLLPINSSDMYYYVDGYLYNNTSFSSLNKGFHSVYAQYGAYISGKIGVNVVPRYSISLTSNKSYAVADGVDKVVLKALVNDKFENPTDEKDITYYVEGSNNYTYYSTSNNELTFTQPGTYYVTANWNGNYQSNQIRISVSQYMKPVITADKTEILSDGVETITFSSTVYDINNQPISYPPSLSYYVNGTYVSGNTYKTTTVGNYTVYATLNGVKSNELAFKTNPVILTANPGVSLKPPKSLIYLKKGTAKQAIYDG